jgi:signal transduction histidine kinase
MTEPKAPGGSEASTSTPGKHLELGHELSTSDSTRLNSQEMAHERLKVLYGISKLLASFVSVESTLPKILTLCGTAFPLLTAIFIERRGKNIVKSVWSTQSTNPEQLARAVANARSSFAYLTGDSLLDSSGHPSGATSSGKIENTLLNDRVEAKNPGRYLALPLTVDRLPAFGVLQLEASSELNERDVEFVDALASLIAVAVDRFYKTQAERERQEKKVSESASKLDVSEAHVTDLETERELRESFVSLLSHDLRTPLSAAKIAAQLIQRQKSNSDATQTLAARIVTSVNRADQMITNLLDANRIRGGEKLPLKIELFRLEDLVKSTLEELATVHGDRFILTGVEHLEVHWDPKGVRRILENLCNNAVKYGEEFAQITVNLGEGPGTARISVQNFGEVISPEEQKDLFQQFKRGRKAEGSKKKGWGIGLTLVRGVAEAHGGTVSVKSEAGIGTIFSVAMPLDSRQFATAEAL